MGEPVEKFARVEVQLRRDLRELVERGLVPAFQNVDEVRDELLVELHAVAEDLERVLARVGIRGTSCCGRLFLGMLQFRRGGEHLQ